MTDHERIAELKHRFNLSYHIDYAFTADQMVGGLQGKRILEVGGSLPRDFVFETFGVRQWIALEETQYWDETLSTGHITGTPPDIGKILRLRDQTPATLSDYDVLTGKIEDYPEALSGCFDVVFSIAAFEHIARLPEALEKIHTSLRPGGILFSLFAPVWCASVPLT
ncbi:MAG: methyltransferase domain-containing protein, partial [Magnetococcales bacterium]|nr:methyltransferase domain-containing protein [Magnetococcales bacterium]